MDSNIIVSVVTIIALFTGPAIAVWVGDFLAHRKEERNRKLAIFQALISTRHNLFAEDRLRAINLIEFVFGRDQQVREAFRQYLEAATPASDDQILTAAELAKVQAKNLELIEAISKNVGLHDLFTTTDFTRMYSPRFLQEQQRRQDALYGAALNFFQKQDSKSASATSKPPNATQ